MTASKLNKNCCWTCRLRRKKCDGIHPVCGECGGLGITCQFSEQKPLWMDGGKKQKKMTADMKNRIRCTAQQRKPARVGTHNPIMGEFAVFAFDSGGDSEFLQDAASSESIQSIHTEQAGILRSLATPQPAHYHVSPELEVSCSSPETYPMTTRLPTTAMFNDCCSSTTGEGGNYETSFLMKYLDFVFPFLFPFYQQSFISTGRSWILTLVHNSQVAMHSVVSLATYFLTVVLTDASHGDYELCKREIWLQLGGQMEKCFKMIRNEICQLASEVSQSTTLVQVRAMESILQFLIFEVAVGGSGNWNMHLTAALRLFEDILRHQPQGQLSQDYLAVLHGIGRASWYNIETQTYIWSPDQSGFRFFSALLIFLDVIGSSACGECPRLLDYYSSILAEADDGNAVDEHAPIRLSEVFGCQNWAIIAIAQTAALAKWKTDRTAMGSLSVMELAKRASAIEVVLQEGFSNMRDKVPQQMTRNDRLNFYCNRKSPSDEVSSDIATEIWAHAAREALWHVPRRQYTKYGVTGGIT